MVLVVIAILASAIITQTSYAVTDSKVSSLKMNVRLLRDQIARYKWEHQEHAPSGSNKLEQLTSFTDVTGALGAAGPNYPFGPYLQSIPPNPFTDSSKIILDMSAPGSAPSGSGANDAGWIYRPSTGEIWADNADYLSF